MGFYATEPLFEAPPKPRPNRRTSLRTRVRRETARTGNPLRGPSTDVVSGYRYYNPTLGRFVNRDPIGGDGGMNLFLFVKNTPISLMDFLGMYSFSPGVGMPPVTIPDKSMPQPWQPVCNEDTLGEKYLAEVKGPYFARYPGGIGSLDDATKFLKFWARLSDTSDRSALISEPIAAWPLILLNMGVSSSIVDQFEKLLSNIKKNQDLELRIDFRCKECKCKDHRKGKKYYFDNDGEVRRYKCKTKKVDYYWGYDEVTLQDISDCQVAMHKDLNLCDKDRKSPDPLD